MAVCETPMFTNDSDMNNHEFSTEASTDSSSETSAILLGSKRKNGVGSGGGTLKGKRRSSRLSKESTCDGDTDQSDDSDPHIDVNVDVIMTNAEEKLMTDEEKKANDRDRIEKQMLAVALVKSVVETKNIPQETQQQKTQEDTTADVKREKDESIKKVTKGGICSGSKGCEEKAVNVEAGSTTPENKPETKTTSSVGSPAMSTRRRTSGIDNTQTQTASIKSNSIRKSVTDAFTGAPNVKIENGESNVTRTTTVAAPAPVPVPPITVKAEPSADVHTTIGTITRAMKGTKNTSTMAKVPAPAATAISVVPSATVTGKPGTTTGVVKTTLSSTSTLGTNTRSRTRASTRTKNMGLKAEYASIREPRFKAQPKPSLPVPNPILSPTTAAAATSTVATATSDAASSTRGHLTRNRRQKNIAKSEGTSSVATNAARSVTSAATNTNTTASQHHHPAAIITPSTISAPADVAIREAQPTPSSTTLPENNLLQLRRVKKEEMSLPMHSQTSSMNTTIDSSSNGTSTPFPNRRRIFSIDLDPEGFDFDLSLGMSIGATDYAENSSELPPIASTSYAASGDNRKNSEGNISNHSNTATDIPPCRDRGMSFELFSFSTANDPTDMKTEALNGGRPRGDSIIFDPISFSDGGIHDENALRKRLGSPPLNDNEEIELLKSNTNTGYVETPHLSHHTSIQTQPLTKQHRPAATLRSSSKSNIPNPVSSHPANFSVRKSGGRYSKSSQSKVTNAYHGHHSKSSHSSSNSSKKHYISSSGKDDTLHMPQGSAAAAAAAASLSSQIMQNTMNGTISHTSCPMELLNKGGRIGIYLPEARRERIAKFHSKRKNRIWRKRIKYDCRKKLADSRPRVKGRFVKSLEGDD